MRKTAVAVAAALVLALGATGVAMATSDGPPRGVVRDQPSLPAGDGPATTVPRQRAPEIPGKPNRQRVPERTGQQMTQTTNTVVRFK